MTDSDRSSAHRTRSAGRDEAPSLTAAPDVTVVVVTWNSEKVLPAALASLPLGLSDVSAWRLVVVDNASDDGTLEVLSRLAPDALVVQTGRNAGYAAAINAGLSAVGPSHAYLVLNPDVRLEPGCVAALQRCLLAAGVGIAVPRTTDADADLVLSLRREPTARRALGEALLGGGRAGRWARWGEVVTERQAYERATTADWAAGAVMLVSAACAADVGAWDESLFLYSEETDFALRARAHGHLLRLCPEARAVHLGGEAHASAELYTLQARNRVRLVRRRHGRLRASRFWCAVALNELLRARRPVHRAALRGLTAVRWPAAGPTPPARAPSRRWGTT